MQNQAKSARLDLMPDDTPEYDRHDYEIPIAAVAEFFPAMSEEQYKSFKDGIALDGQQDPIKIWRGELVDGRHRLRACKELGIPVRCKDIDDESDSVFAGLTANLARRHMSTSQIAVTYGKLFQGRSAGRPQNTDKTKAMRKLESTFVISKGTKKRGLKVVSNSPKEIIEAVEIGQVSIADAADIADKPVEEQLSALKMVASGRAKRLTQAIISKAKDKDVAVLRTALASRPDMNLQPCSLLDEEQPDLPECDWVIAETEVEPPKQLKNILKFAGKHLGKQGHLMLVCSQDNMPGLILAMQDTAWGWRGATLLADYTVRQRKMVLIYAKSATARQRPGTHIKKKSDILPISSPVESYRLTRLGWYDTLFGIVKPAETICAPVCKDGFLPASAVLLNCRFFGGLADDSDPEEAAEQIKKAFKDTKEFLQHKYPRYEQTQML